MDSRQIFDRETASNQARELIGQCHCFGEVDASDVEFPGCDAIGVKPHSPIVTAVALCCEARRYWADHADNSGGFGAVASMIMYGIVSAEDVRCAISRARAVCHYRATENPGFEVSGQV